MTHAEALHDNRAGLEPSPCPGELSPHGRYPDRVLSKGVLRERTVEVLRCADCETYVVLAEGAVVNAYQAPLPGDVILGLVESRGIGRRAPR